MSHRPLRPLLDHLRHAAGQAGGVAPTDAQLLDRWARRRDQAAFELLLWRHGPMVLATCRRLLGRVADVEDAFQATFLVLVRKAGSIRQSEAVGAWLHRVACRVALRARTAALRRTNREQVLEDPPAAPLAEEAECRELRAVLDEEIDRLPSRYRRAVVLCCLEGKSQEEACRLLACPRGTLSSWLTRARERLRHNLLRRGVAVSGTVLAAALVPDTSAGSLAPLLAPLVDVAAAGQIVSGGSLSSQTIALAEGMLQTMLMTRIKIAVAVLFLATLFAAGIGTFSLPTQAADPPAVGEQKTATMKQRIKPTEGLLEWNIELKLKSPDGIAWGKAAHGLQAGIAIRPGDDSSCSPGASVTFVVYLRNVGKKEVRLTHRETLFLETMPVVEEEHGLRLVVALGPIDSGVAPLVRRTIKPGQRITLGYPWFRIRPVDWRGEERGPTCCLLPGRYKVRYAGLPLRIDGEDTDVIGPPTGQIEFEVRTADASPDARPAVGRTGAPMVERMLAFKPRQKDVDYTTPPPEKWAGCKAELVKDRTGTSWVLKDEKGEILRRFTDTNGDNRIDVWAYYKDGVEVYADINTTFRGEPDQYRWFNPAPERSTAKTERPAGAKMFFVRTRSFQIPIHAAAGRLRSVRLHVSRDNGAGYQLVKKLPASATRFDFQAREDGEYCFAIQTEEEDGQLQPKDLAMGPPAVVVVVDTTPPAAKLEKIHDTARRVLWRVSDTNLDLTSLRMELRESDDEEFTAIRIKGAAKGIFDLPRGFRGGDVRLRVRDRAGNETIAALHVKPERGQQ